jgi:NAD(P)H-hydrate epimerase
MGAVLLSAEACMRSGSGLCTIHIPSHGLVMAQIKLREAMISLDVHPNNISSLPDPEHYKAIGIGPGLGTAQETANAVRDWLSHCSKHVVLDADALNIIAQHPENRIWPKQAVITPHIGEFDRLFGVHNNNFERIETMRKASIAHEIVIILKGHYTAVASPDGLLSFNSSGFSGLATAGAGDVLTGIITGLLCQGYDAAHAARLGVFLHGEAGHAAGYELSVETMLAGDIITHLSKPFSQLNDLLPM